MAHVVFTPSSSSSLLDLDVQGALCRTGVCTFYDMLHVFDGSPLHELWLVFRNLLEAAWVCLWLEQRLLRTCHNRGRSAASCNWLTDAWSSNAMSHEAIVLRLLIATLHDNLFLRSFSLKRNRLVERQKWRCVAGSFSLLCDLPSSAAKLTSSQWAPGPCAPSCLKRAAVKCEFFSAFMLDVLSTVSH